jgi:hypothetical protein
VEQLNSNFEKSRDIFEVKDEVNITCSLFASKSSPFFLGSGRDKETLE